MLCTYCSHRQHPGHFLVASNIEVEKIKESLQKKLTQDTVEENLMKRIEQEIIQSKIEFKKCLRERKLLNIMNYINFLNKEEEKLKFEFEEIVSTFKNEFAVTKSMNNIHDLLQKSDFELLLLRENINNFLENEQASHVPVSKEVSLLQYHFLAPNPFGNIMISSSQTDPLALDAKDPTSFRFIKVKTEKEAGLDISGSCLKFLKESK